MDIQEIMSSLPKRKNTSQNKGLTMQRCKDVWKGLKNAQKNEVLELSKVSSATIHGTYKYGHLSAPVALAIAQVADVNPLYLTGVVNRIGKFTDEAAEKFLINNGFKEAEIVGDDVIDESVNSVEPVSEHSIIQEKTTHDKHQCTCGYEDIVLSEDEVQAIIKCLFIRAKYNEDATKKLAVIIQNLLF